MALFVHITQRCEEEAASSGWQEDLSRLKNKVELAQDLMGFQHFPKPYRVKKQWPRYNARLIASVHQVGDHDVASFLSILTKADPAYDQFQNNPSDYGSRNFDGLVSEADLQRIVDERTAVSPPEPKPLPSESEYAFLYRAASGVELGNNKEGLICETPAWVTKVSASPVKERLTEFHKALEHIQPGNDFIPLPGRAGWGIFYAHHPNLQITILLEPVSGDASGKLASLRQKYSALLENNGDATEELLLKSCQRAYPDYLRCGEDEWLEVQKDAVANIALSREETKVLEASRQAKGAFPLFINGRAGSGKSTLLQYIFTEHLHRYFTLDEDLGFKPPLYLTCSSELLRHSRTIVEKLLKCNANFLNGGKPLRLDNFNRPIVETAFQEFRPLLLSHLPAEEQFRRFLQVNRVDYSLFRKLWHQKFSNDADARKHFGPDISWHVIRTYIKGMSSESYQDPDEYKQFDDKERQVPDEVFQMVYDRVWDKWYRPLCEVHARWDDQDLARHLIEGGLIKPERPAIFCDEAQDFTRLELEIILRLCLFSNRTISPHEISRIPLVFAGDPFQTLNPTGFRWEATKAAFVEKFILSLDPNRRSGMDDLNYTELTYNYRSTRRIVEFSNLVQALRCHLFDLRRVKPQEPWASDQNPPPVVWFDSNDARFWERLRQERGVTIIVPCGEGEEQEFVKQNPILRQWIKVDENGVPVDLNVFSAGRAKGLEFDRVAVFGFGDQIHNDGLKIQCLDEVKNKSDISLPLEYFINRLYVSVSRPKRRLIIVDSQSGREQLWKFATDAGMQEKILSAILQHAPEPEIWEGKTAGMTEGLLEQFDTEEFTNFEEEAKNLKAQGISQGDSYLLRSAANRFRLAGLQGEANYCLAEALFAEGKYLDAGKAFADCGQFDRAVEAYWHAGRSGDQSLLEIATARPNLQNRLECVIARFLNSPDDWKAGYQALSKLTEHVVKPEDAIVFTSCNYWTEPTRRVAEKLVDLGEKSTKSPDWVEVSVLFDRLESAGFGLKTSQRARVCYLAADWTKAVTLWESANEKTSKEYREAKARIAPYPEQLNYLKDLGKNDAILEAFKSNPEVVLDADSKRIVGVALAAAKRFDDALEQFANAGAISELGDLAAAALSDGAKESAIRAIRLCFVLSVQQSHWNSIREYLNNGHLPRASKEVQKALDSLIKDLKWDMDCLLVASFARSDSLTRLDNSEQKLISKFLRDLDRNCEWNNRISVEELGAAIERAQRYIDAVEFYEKAMTSAPNDEQRRFAIIRWVKSSQHLETYYQGDKQYRKAEDIKRDWEKVKTTHEITVVELAPEYPELDTLPELFQRVLKKPDHPVPIAPAVEQTATINVLPPEAPLPSSRSTTEPPSSSSKSNAKLVLGELEIKLSRENQRINLEHLGTSMTATVRLSPIRCTSEDVVWKPVESSGLMFRCEDWGLLIDFTQLEAKRQVLLQLVSAGIELTLKVD